MTPSEPRSEQEHKRRPRQQPPKMGPMGNASTHQQGQHHVDADDLCDERQGLPSESEKVTILKLHHYVSPEKASDRPRAPARHTERRTKEVMQIAAAGG
eukprot:CAMPEP_0175065404 /NCGR_PEP_ID=MMETSP0052_2-20121109/15902_1 /TAXON_ID=51329 ORGANISM="Polytomella parva, Strain SAG 63-3" /NCGR_SAMPLE_ID=MMETSP0052_2 /ASSEMBLY_ACC=CAM_ASM_000194 /LENGTH=98 /DNA_ID=CAMNT_0016331927 /DNA_START=206 /DNA_END=502 /DNA_ORIENTATION=-